MCLCFTKPETPPFPGQLLSPSCNITGVFLAIRGPDRLGEAPAATSGGRAVCSRDRSRGKGSESLRATATATLFQLGKNQSDGLFSLPRAIPGHLLP